jgi:hypothetical protein
MCKYRVLLICAGLSSGFCSNSSSSTYNATSSSPYTFSLSVPGYPNKKVSGYVFANGALVGVIRSNMTTDSQGYVSATAMAVDANNCATSNVITTNYASYRLHWRLDGAGNNTYVYPLGCPSDAGFLNNADLGLVQTSPYASYWPYSLYALYVTYSVTYTFSGTGLGSVTRLTQCNILDAYISNPTMNTSSAMGYASGNVVFTSGSGSLTSSFRIASAVIGTYKHVCWIDANNSGTYNSGDLTATTTDSTTISSWTTVP